METPPNKIHLQFYGDSAPDEGGDISPGDVTWCVDRIFSADELYIKASHVLDWLKEQQISAPAN